MGQNVSGADVDTSLDTISPYIPQEKRLLILWLTSAYGMAMIWFTILLCDRWGDGRRRVRRVQVLGAIFLGIVWPLVFLYLMVTDDWDLWRVGRRGGIEEGT